MRAFFVIFRSTDTCRYAAQLARKAGCCDILTNATVLDLLAFYVEPERAAIPVMTLRCSLCGKTFEVKVGEHYSKFDFVYCSRACLSQHRRLLFAVEHVKGPLASEQNL